MSMKRKYVTNHDLIFRMLERGRWNEWNHEKKKLGKNGNHSIARVLDFKFLRILAYRRNFLQPNYFKTSFNRKLLRCVETENRKCMKNMFLLHYIYRFWGSTVFLINNALNIIYIRNHLVRWENTLNSHFICW